MDYLKLYDTLNDNPHYILNEKLRVDLCKQINFFVKFSVRLQFYRTLYQSVTSLIMDALKIYSKIKDKPRDIINQNLRVHLQKHNEECTTYGLRIGIRGKFYRDIYQSVTIIRTESNSLMGYERNDYESC
jgi:hypothetical protein